MKRKPRRFSSFAIALDSGVVAARSWPLVGGLASSGAGAKLQSRAARVSPRSCRARVAVGGHLGDVPAVEGATKGFALAQDGQPRQPRLKRLEDEHLEQLALVVYRAAPDSVVVIDVFRGLEAPPAPRPAVRARLD